MLEKPKENEAPSWSKKYIDLCEDKDLFLALHTSFEQTLKVFTRFKKDKEEYAYQAGKWNVKEVLCHIIDTEKVFSYRALRFSRKDGSILNSFDQNLFVAESNTADRSLIDLLQEYEAVRTANIMFFKYLSLEQLDFMGSVEENQITARSLAWMIAGHNIHHTQFVKENYTK
jgi:uncharacterized damage-inducible protein DinB